MARPLDTVEIEGPWPAALRLAWEAHGTGNIGVGAVLTDPTGAIVAIGRNRVIDGAAPPGRLRSTYLAHAEMDVLAQLRHGDYPDHVLWTTLEPCLMCASAVVLSHVGTVRHAAADPCGRASIGWRASTPRQPAAGRSGTALCAARSPSSAACFRSSGRCVRRRTASWPARTRSTTRPCSPLPGGSSATAFWTSCAAALVGRPLRRRGAGGGF